jgi:outer membrane murein-binding lipoprotein Lpp
MGRRVQTGPPSPPPPPLPYPTHGDAGPSLERVETAHRSGHRPRQAVIAFLLGCLLSGGLMWALSMRAEDDDHKSNVLRRVARLEAINGRLERDLQASRQRARAAERSADRARREAERARREAERASRQATRRADGARRHGNEVAVGWGGWDGLFDMTGTALEVSDGRASVVGAIEYLGGGACELGSVELTATFFVARRVVGRGSWSAPTLDEHVPTAVKASGPVSAAPRRAELLLSNAFCAD